MTKRKSRLATHGAFAGFLALAGMLVGCGSTNSGKSAGAGGHAGTGGSLASGGGGILGSGGTSSSGGITGPSSGGAGSGSTSSGGIAGTAVGGVGAGGGGSGGVGGQPSGGAGSGGIGTGGTGGGGANGVDAGGPDAGCVGVACSQDAGSNQDVPPACSLIRTQAACDERSDCHSVSFDQRSCGCATSGCCTSFDHCDYGGTVPCSGQISCTQPTPYCESPYAVQYQGTCFNGCVLASKCAPAATCPSTAPSNGGSCGGTSLSCLYQDCAGAGRTQAVCQGGAWSVQTVSCDSVACKGGGVYHDGDVICGSGQICVHTTGGGGAYIVTPSCATNNCGSSPVSLSCVQGLSGSCAVVSDSEINCSLQSCTGSTCPP